MIAINQLLLAKRLFIEASEYADRPDPVSSGIAISMLHDSTELYLWTVIKERNVTVKNRSDFGSYIDALLAAGIEIPNAGKLRELNTARVNFKHYGNVPDVSEARKHKTYVEDFLRQAMKLHFLVNLDELSLVDLVSWVVLREELRAAESLIQAGTLSEAAKKLAIAKSVVFERMQSYVPRADSSLIRADRLINSAAGASGARFFEYLFQYLSALREATLVALFQIPIVDYRILESILPLAMRRGSGNWIVMRANPQITEQQCRRAVAIVVGIWLRIEGRL